MIHKPIFTAEVYAPKSVDPTETTLLTPVVGAVHSEPFRIATGNVSGFRPYMQIPTGRRGKVDIKTKNTDIGSLTLVSLDPRVVPSDNRSRWLTAYLGDAKGIDRILKCKVIVKRSLDNGATFKPYFTGRIKDAKQKEILEFTLLLDDIMKEADMTLFAMEPHASVAYAQINPILPFSLDKDWIGFKPELPILSQVRTAAQGYQYYVNCDYRSKYYAQQAILSDGLRKLASKIKPGASGLLRRQELTFPIGRIKARIKNRATSAVAWYNIPYMVFYQNVDKHWQLGNYAVDVPIPMTFPGPGTSLEVRFFARTIPTDDAAIFIDKVEIPTLLRDICAGKFAPLNTDGSVFRSIPIDEPSFAALDGDPKLPKVAFRITEQDTFKKWVPENLLQPFQLALDPTPDGKLRLVDMRLSEQLEGLDPDEPLDTVFDGAGGDLISSNEGEGWSSLSDDAINRVDAWYYRATMQPRIQPAADKAEYPTVPPARIDVATQPVIPLYIGPRSLDFGTKNFKLDLKGIMANGDNDIIVTLAKDSWDDVEAIRIAERLSDELQGPFQAGAQYLATSCRVNDKTEDIKPGTRKILKISTLPDPYTKKRGEPQYAICLDRQEQDLVTKFTWLSLGPAGITDPPVLGELTLVAGDSHHSVNQVVTLNAAGDPVVIEYALTETDVVVRPTTGWVRGAVATVNGTYTLGRFPSNMRVWTRGYSSPRLNNIKRPDSIYAFPTDPVDGFIDLLPYNPPVSLTNTGATGNTLHFSLVPGEPELRTQVLVQLDESAYADWDDSNVVETLEAGTTLFDYSSDLPTGTHSFGVRHVDPFGGVTAVTQIDVVWVSANTQAPRPAGFDFVAGSSIILQLFTSNPSFYWIIDRAPDNGANAPNLGAVVRIVDLDQLLPSSETLFYDPLPPDGTKWWYQVYLGKPGYDISDPVPWKSFTPLPVDINNDGIPDNTGSGVDGNVEANPVEPTFNFVQSQTLDTATLTVVVTDPQQRLIKVEFKHKVGFGGAETAYVTDTVLPYSDSVGLVEGETSSITARFTYYQADGALRVIERSFTFSRSVPRGAPVDATYTTIDDEQAELPASYHWQSGLNTTLTTDDVEQTVQIDVEPNDVGGDPGSTVGRPGNMGPFPFIDESGGEYVIGNLPNALTRLTNVGRYRVDTTYATGVTLYCDVIVAGAAGTYITAEYSPDNGSTWFPVEVTILLSSVGTKAAAGPLPATAIGGSVLWRASAGGGDDETSPEVYNFAIQFTVTQPVISGPPALPGEPIDDRDAVSLLELYDDGDLVTAVPDVSTVGNPDAVPDFVTFGQGAPTFRREGFTGGRPCIEFDNSNDGLRIAGSQITNGTFTLYLVLDAIGTPGGPGIGHIWDAPNNPRGKGITYLNPAVIVEGGIPKAMGCYVNNHPIFTTFINMQDTWDRTLPHIYRFAFSKGTGHFWFFVDGILKGENDCPAQFTESIDIFIGFRTGLGAGGFKLGRGVTYAELSNATGLDPIEDALKEYWGTP